MWGVVFNACVFFLFYQICAFHDPIRKLFLPLSISLIVWKENCMFQQFEKKMNTAVKVNDGNTLQIKGNPFCGGWENKKRSLSRQSLLSALCRAPCKCRTSSQGQTPAR